MPIPIIAWAYNNESINAFFVIKVMCDEDHDWLFLCAGFTYVYYYFSPIFSQTNAWIQKSTYSWAELIDEDDWSWNSFPLQLD